MHARRRMLNAVLQLAYEGGYEAVQVRAVAEQAGVSSRTIYAHFPSLDSLLIAAVVEQSQRLSRRVIESPPDGPTPAARVNVLVGDLTKTMTESRLLSVALVRALLSGKPDVARYVETFGDTIRAMFASAIAPGGPTSQDNDAAAVLESVWFHAVVSWATSAEAAADPGDVMRRAVGALFGTKETL